MSFLLNPSSPSSGSSPTTSAPDSLTSSPGIAETNLTTVIDDASKSQLIVAVPATPSDFSARRSGFVTTSRQDEDEDVDTTAAAAAPMHVEAGTTADSDAWSHRVQSPLSEASPATSNASTIPATTNKSYPGAHLSVMTDAELPSPYSSSGYSPASAQPSPASSSASSAYSESGAGFLESSSTSEEDASSSSSTERLQTRIRTRSATDTAALGSGSSTSIARVRIAVPESLLFSHSLPDAVSAKGKGKGKEREMEPENLGLREKGKYRETVNLKHHRRRSSGTSTRSKIRTRSGVAVMKYQEQGISRDFFLIVALCVGLACASVLVARPAVMSMTGRAGSVSFSLDDLD